ncbi:MAG TPA: ABC transporter permease [Rhizobiaceae bacterium]|nr:ABC transporter permease [Rhizobiaceae bacterium]
MLTNAASDASAAPTSGEDAPQISTRHENGRVVYAFSGRWTTRSVASVDAEMRHLEKETANGSVALDLSAVRRIDTAGAWLIERLIESAESRGQKVEVIGESDAARILLNAVGAAARKERESAPAQSANIVIRFFESVGRLVYNGVDDLRVAMYILGATIRGAQTKVGRGHAVNIAAIVNQIDRMGVGAIPVVCLMSAIVGGIVAQQGAFQLRYFGAEIFVVDLVGILILRELGVLMTAVMVAGRSGSAITAEIGSMKMREEVDALTVIGLNPVGVLVFPRLVALLIAVPCLTVLANFAALGGAIFVAWSYSNIPPEQFIDRLRVGIDLSTIFSGMIKAPFMALIIGIIASQEGLKVGGSAESLGRQVTASVVKAIFVVIVVDGFFAMFYAAIDF